eukprot:TRINITY_DN62738_c0_g1_i1.p1 TRINITY_DN62738_c0_g1~~TRINITY_DN62738_c0_g1_i1.p1  ORF type:complete len:222 (+),score=17.06 TRINITY_DN62738_c0_g1_i1:63-728(+)
MVLICLGPVCIPIWMLFPPALALFYRIWEWISVKILGRAPTQPPVSAASAAPATDNSPPVPASGSLERVMSEVDWDMYVEERQRTGTPVVILFSAPTCAPCRLLVPVFESLAKSHQPKIETKSTGVSDGSPSATDAATPVASRSEEQSPGTFDVRGVQFVYCDVTDGVGVSRAATYCVTSVPHVVALVRGQTVASLKRANPNTIKTVVSDAMAAAAAHAKP